jgi:hypothetical protein
VTVTRTTEYRGQASFSGGTVKILNYEPMAADMRTTFRIDGGKVFLNRIDLVTDGAETVLDGEVDLTRWPEQTYRLKSVIDFPRMREIFFARDTFSLYGTGGFEGTFHLFRETLPDGRTRTGRELKGRFTSDLAGVNAYRFGNLQGHVLWVPEKMEVTDAAASFYGGQAQFEYLMAPLGVRGVPVRHRFDAEYEDVDLSTFTDFLELQGPASPGAPRGATCSSGRRAGSRRSREAARCGSIRRAAWS